MRTLLLTTAFFLFVSCEKVIELPLKSAQPLLVIEGNIEDDTDVQVIRVSRSIPFNEEESQRPVSGATVSVLSDRYQSGSIYNQSGGIYNQSVVFTEERPGYYVARKFRGLPGTSYQLEVEYEGIKYKAVSIMPHKVLIDSVGISETNILNRSFWSVNVLFQDPPEEENYYRFAVYSEGNQQASFVYNDRFNNGKKVLYNLGMDDLDPQRGDTVWVRMLAIDESIYRYWRAVQDQNPGTAHPANPPSNISNGALGYFSAHAVERVHIVVE